jgi:hypothetical protein
MSTPCHTRITNKHFQYFADGVHKFYLEHCCQRPCLEGSNRCASCIKIHAGARSQFDSTYPHGHMSEPIPEHSHIFGGSWYQNRVQLWGEPSPQVIALAMQHQREAQQYIPLASKAKIASISQDMARKKVVSEATVSEATVSEATVSEATVVEAVSEVSAEPVKKPRKPRVARSTMIVETAAPVVAPVAAPVASTVIPIKAAKPKKAAKPSPKVESVPVQETRVCKEVVIPTYIEQQIEEIDTNDYEIEYVPLTFIEIGQTTYFRDPKNKLYQKVKEKIIGPYIGRYCPHTESICTEVPDSDEENDS